MSYIEKLNNEMLAERNNYNKKNRNYIHFYLAICLLTSTDLVPSEYLKYH